MSQAQKRFWKRDNEVGISIIFGIFGMDAGWMQGQIMAVFLCMHSGFPTKIMEQMIMTSLYDVTRFSHVTEGWNYKGECN